jgi:hypothetical protein
MSICFFFVDVRCDIFEERSSSEQRLLWEGFLRFLESVNKIRRPPPNRMPKVSKDKHDIIVYYIK